MHEKKTLFSYLLIKYLDPGVVHQTLPLRYSYLQVNHLNKMFGDFLEKNFWTPAPFIIFVHSILGHIWSHGDAAPCHLAYSSRGVRPRNAPYLT